jgi:hypothetical protein
MGDIADMMLEGILCQYCGVANEGESYGIPWTCPACVADGMEEPEPPKPKKNTGPRWNSLQMANNARQNKGKSPWRDAPHVNSPANQKRREDGFKK